MKIAFIALAILSAAPLAQAAGNGDHPAIVARRVIAAQGFDHASAFYRHPAGLALAAAAPAGVSEQAVPVVAMRTPAAARSSARAAVRK